MYEARQNKEKVSRGIEGGMTKQRKESKVELYKLFSGDSCILQKKEIKEDQDFSSEKNPGNVHGYSYNNNTWSVLLEKIPGGRSNPDKIEDMDKDYIKNIIKDPSRNDRQNLTKMHMVRAIFGGINGVANLKLGTQASNNSHPNSHLHEVEEPISKYFTRDRVPKRVDYRVNIKDASVPDYLQNKLNDQHYDEEKKRLAQSFLEVWCPSVIHCEADFYKQINGAWMVSEHESDVRMDLGSN